MSGSSSGRRRGGVRDWGGGWRGVGWGRGGRVWGGGDWGAGGWGGGGGGWGGVGRFGEMGNWWDLVKRVGLGEGPGWGVERNAEEEGVYGRGMSGPPHKLC